MQTLHSHAAQEPLEFHHNRNQHEDTNKFVFSYYFVPERVANLQSIAINMTVCLCVHKTRKPHDQTSPNCLWPWLDQSFSDGVAVQCISSFVDDVKLLYNGANGQNQA